MTSFYKVLLWYLLYVFVVVVAQVTVKDMLVWHLAAVRAEITVARVNTVIFFLGNFSSSKWMGGDGFQVHIQTHLKMYVPWRGSRRPVVLL